MNNEIADTEQEVLKGKKVLLVEDDSFLGKILKERLLAVGALVTHVERGDTAWEEVQKNVPEAMLLDIRLPGLDGFQILEGMREEKKTKDVPVIIISNFDQVKDKEHGTKLGAEFLVKALVTPDDIVEALRKVFNSKK